MTQSPWLLKAELAQASHDVQDLSIRLIAFAPIVVSRNGKRKFLVLLLSVNDVGDIHNVLEKGYYFEVDGKFGANCRAELEYRSQVEVVSYVPHSYPHLLDALEKAPDSFTDDRSYSQWRCRQCASVVSFTSCYNVREVYETARHS